MMNGKYPTALENEAVQDSDDQVGHKKDVTTQWKINFWISGQFCDICKNYQISKAGFMIHDQNYF